ncbi:MAG: 3-deoxy-manno-octulosonate cytidylyltransferase [Alphaproteobacteria bacterium]|jgi:3-deoxy-manno-octulosonate cytidylyltransferase (CMP-KDO synthetase)|nr:3-deoxy-manno-octulosonate cytidylyltransferase [Alphaproteobacteria bacterium]
MTVNNPIIIIPARMLSTRLPNKLIADINGKTLVEHVYDRAMEADFAEVLVACDDQRIVDVIEAVGGKTVLTDPELPSGSDRIFAALQKFDPEGKYDSIINLQGDEPTVNPENVKKAFDLLQNSGCDMTTLGSYFVSQEDIENPGNVKAIAEIKEGEDTGRALYFSRNVAPSNTGFEGKYIHHIGLYAYTREALASFVASPQGELEKREKLEQLRALGMGMSMQIGIVDERPLGVDTLEDLERARQELK